MFAQLVENSLRFGLRGLANEQRVQFQAATDRFLNQPHAFHSAQPIRGLTVGKGLTQLLH